MKNKFYKCKEYGKTPNRDFSQYIINTMVEIKLKSPVEIEILVVSKANTIVRPKVKTLVETQVQFKVGL